MRRLFAVFFMTLSLIAGAPSRAQEAVLKSGEGVDLFPVYWVSGCKSTLKRFIGADVFSGPPELKAELKEGLVAAKRQGCADMVPGATLRLRADDVRSSFDGSIRIRVRYETEEGEKQSLHTVKVTLLP